MQCLTTEVEGSGAAASTHRTPVALSFGLMAQRLSRKILLEDLKIFGACRHRCHSVYMCCWSAHVSHHFGWRACVSHQHAGRTKLCICRELGTCPSMTMMSAVSAQDEMLAQCRSVNHNKSSAARPVHSQGQCMWACSVYITVAAHGRDMPHSSTVHAFAISCANTFMATTCAISYSCVCCVEQKSHCKL